MNNRRKIVIALGAASLVSPLSSLAQSAAKIWRIGLLRESEHPMSLPFLEGFRTGMRDLGYAENRDYVIEVRSAKGDIARLRALAAELLALKVDVILATGTPSAVAAFNVTPDVPIVIAAVGDPVGSGLAVSLRRPGRNVTGLSNGVGTALITKRLDLLRQMVPGLRRVGLLYHPDNGSDVLGLRQFEDDCATLKFKPLPARVRKAQDLAAAFDTLQREKAQGLVLNSSSSFNAWRESIYELAAKHRLPAIYGNSLLADSRGFVSYSTDNADLYRRSAAYVDKIFKGAKPGDLPIEQPTRFELVLNMKTAKALGLKISNSVLVQATRVIE